MERFSFHTERCSQRFSDVTDAQRAQRYDDRVALEEQMRAAGVNPGLVGDRFAMIDAVAGAGAEGRGAYLDDMGLVSQMADADRKFMGEGIFGGTSRICGRVPASWVMALRWTESVPIMMPVRRRCRLLI